MQFTAFVFNHFYIKINIDRNKGDIMSIIIIIIIIIEFNSGTIKIELDNTMWTVQPEQGRKG